ncbi:hypothetical protein TNCV_646951 [Trichonephila clavipes]|nr:hypothetical protein TNCV_646951 [Trichonephila clavipes]
MLKTGAQGGLVLDVKNTCWYFWDNPTHKYTFGDELDTPSIVEKMSSNTCQLREGVKVPLDLTLRTRINWSPIRTSSHFYK